VAGGAVIYSSRRKDYDIIQEKTGDYRAEIGYQLGYNPKISDLDAGQQPIFYAHQSFNMPYFAPHCTGFGKTLVSNSR
jgi:hypothetical protein